jgi:hypothetical protein
MRATITGEVDFIWSSLVAAVLRVQQRGLNLVPGHLDHHGASDQPVKRPRRAAKDAGEEQHHLLLVDLLLPGFAFTREAGLTIIIG